jgi:hypothetical protein
MFFALFLILLALLFFVILIQKSEECPSCPECNCPQCPECVMDCSLCPEKVKTEKETIEITRYVCSDESVVDNKEDCFKEAESDIDFQPVLTNEEGTSIVNATVKPACISGNNGGWIYFKTDVLPKEVIFEVKESADDEYSEIYSMNGLFERYTYFQIGDTYSGNAEFNLEEDSVYLFRIKFNVTLHNKVYYSNEHIIDTRADSDYMKKDCS